MKIAIFIAVMALFAITSGVFVPPRHKKKVALLGADHCTWGPTHWCRNLTNAADCHATRHCIDTVWSHQTLPIDNSSVCQICLDMVKQARDQLESNETQELIKEVFEGTCALIHIKPIVEECDKIADNYIPDLIETLASEMNPQVVCSVAGLCNSEKVHRLLEEERLKTEVSVQPSKRDKCQDCYSVVSLAEEKFNKLSRDEFLQNLVLFCGKMGSFSDGCSNIVITYFEEIYSHVQEHLNPNEFCLMSGECSAKFHKHNPANVEITPMSHVGYVPVNGDKENDDLPCDLCEQLVGHLKELLIANTTEEEFEMVLQGLCKQTGKFSGECLSLVQQYYAEIYQYLVNNLNSSEVCALIGICPNQLYKESVIAPLLPPKTAKVALSLSQPQDKPLVHIQLHSDKSSLLLPPGLVQEPQQPQQLPIELLMPPHTQVLYNKQVCQFCEYFLHFVQEQISEPKNEEKIKDVIDKACQKLPSSINDSCVEFVNTYEPALIALLAQELDPSQICPLIKACPSSENKDVEIFMQAKGDSKCPLCLFAVTKLESMVKDKKTEETIKEALDKLCEYLPGNMKDECQDFVHTYADELIEMLVADLKPEEVCVYLKLCTDNKPAKQLPPYVRRVVGGNVETNAIPDNTVNGKVISEEESSSVEEGPQCVLCEFVMKEIEDQLQDKTTDKEIEQVVRKICNIMPSSVSKQCNDFVDEYGDAVIQLLIETLKPNEICPMLKLCNSQVIQNMHGEILECPICQLTVEAMEKILANPKIDHDVEHVLEKTCRGVPTQYRNKCESLIESYGEAIAIEYFEGKNANQICVKFSFCHQHIQVLVGENRCTYGPSYWCQHEGTAEECGASIFCETKIWNNGRKKRELLGSNPCTYGPSYWCANEENANKCETKQYCDTNGWNRQKRQLLGSDPCTRGPAYWCSSPQNAEKCASVKYCTSNVWSNQRRKRGLLGSDPCTYGPDYWCNDSKNADKCEARSYCETNVWKNGRTKRQLGADPCSNGPSYWCINEINANRCRAKQYCDTNGWNREKRELLGSDPCTRGPAYWCANQENAEKCGSKKYCTSNVWGNQRTKRGLLGSDPCTRGPAYWCASQENAEKCGSKNYCTSNVWGNQRTKRGLLGSDPCTRGPAYWCDSQENAEKCGSKKYCTSNVWGNQRTKRRLLGSDPCTRGPAYWCASQENAKKCGSKNYCTSNVWGNQRIKRGLLGSDPCTYGPSYWCASPQNAEKCESQNYCSTNVWGNQRTKRGLLGSDPCTYGPDYWCDKPANADKCEARSYCESNVWKNGRPKRDLLVGSNPCTYGPSYWCASPQNAEKCESQKYCSTNVWGNQRTKRGLLGSDPCTYGPDYWCDKPANADKCEARSYCESNVWKNGRPKRDLLVGSNPCTYGPSYWCASPQNAEKCESQKYCSTNVWGNQRTKRRVLESDPCTYGPDFWCKNPANAYSCEARAYCETNIWRMELF